MSNRKTYLRPAPHLVATELVAKPDTNPLAGFSNEATQSAVTDLHIALRGRRMTDTEKLGYLRERAAHHQAAIDAEESARIIYAARTADGHVKVGSTDDLVRRMAQHGIPLTDVIATMPGGYRTERAIHRRLKPSRVAGLETYAWTQPVQEFVQSMSMPSPPKSQPA